MVAILYLLGAFVASLFKSRRRLEVETSAGYLAAIRIR
jgi:hypothetical protein